jgi:hypothetical protein
MPKVVRSRSPDCQGNIRHGKTDTKRFRINLNARVYISAADHEIRFGKPRDKRSSQHTLIKIVFREE